MAYSSRVPSSRTGKPQADAAQSLAPRHGAGQLGALLKGNAPVAKSGQEAVPLRFATVLTRMDPYKIGIGDSASRDTGVMAGKLREFSLARLR
jgi:hypothetical protein